MIDLSKAKVTFKDKDGKAIKKLGYTGSPLTPDVEVTIKTKGKNITISPSQYDIQWTNNINKGRATVVLTGNSKKATGSEYTFVGSKTATFTITAGNIKDINNLFNGAVSKDMSYLTYEKEQPQQRVFVASFS